MSPEAATAAGAVLVALIGLIAGRRTERSAQQATTATVNARPAGLSEEESATIGGFIETVRHLAERVEHLEADVRDARNLLGAATVYITRLLDYINTHLPGRDDAPELPERLRGHMND